MRSLVLFLSFITSSSFAQVKSKAYGNMLDDLLSHSVNEIAVEEVDQTDPSIVYLDAREKNEYDVSHIKNAIWVGYDDFNMSRVKNIAKDKKIIVYCSVGYRSEKVSEKLVSSGYGNVFNLYGSIFEWVNQGNPVYDKNGNKTEKIHAYNKEWGQWLTKGAKVYK